MLPVIEQATAYLREAGIPQWRVWCYVLVQDVEESHRRALACRSASISRCWFLIRSAAANCTMVSQSSPSAGHSLQYAQEFAPFDAQHRSAITISSLVMFPSSVS